MTTEDLEVVVRVRWYSDRMVLTLDVLILLIGLLMFILSVNPKLIEIGKIMFFCALLALLLGGERVVALFQR